MNSLCFMIIGTFEKQSYTKSSKVGIQRQHYFIQSGDKCAFASAAYRDMTIDDNRWLKPLRSMARWTNAHTHMQPR